jgi:hypothetical protein
MKNILLVSVAVVAAVFAFASPVAAQQPCFVIHEPSM